MQEGILQYAKDCPDGKMALLGYSQGAHVTMDSVCGGSGGVFDKAPPIPEEIVKKSMIKYVVDRYNSASNNNTSQSSTSMPGSATGTSTDAASSTTAATATDNNRATATSAGPSSAVDTTTASAVSSAVSSVATASGTANTTSSPSPSVVHSGSSRLEAVSALRMALIAMGLLVWGMMAQG
ncbi:hypothetical protein ACCO45_012044 [Purpureocillium lilacinum]|uniref:Uncharacterized protein n=1 Tax=Purpureocillium lilacinum TaxID=33203 RepID=A0ACC4DD96_PURLI